jgi:hypothetical protein
MPRSTTSKRDVLFHKKQAEQVRLLPTNFSQQTNNWSVSVDDSVKSTPESMLEAKGIPNTVEEFKKLQAPKTQHQPALANNPARASTTARRKRKTHKRYRPSMMQGVLMLAALAALAQSADAATPELHPVGPQPEPTPDPAKHNPTPAVADPQPAPAPTLFNIPAAKEQVSRLFHQGIEFTKTKQYHKAIAAYTEGLIKLPDLNKIDRAKFLHELAKCNFNLENFKQALKDINQALLLDNSNHESYAVRFEIHQALTSSIPDKTEEKLIGPLKTMIEDLNAAIAINNTKHVYFWLRAETHWQQANWSSDHQLAIESCEKAIADYTSSYQLSELPDQILCLKRINDSLKLMINKNPSNSDYLYRRAKNQSKLFSLTSEQAESTGLIEEIIQDLDKAIDLNKAEPKYFLLRAETYAARAKRQPEVQKAREDYEQAVKNFEMVGKPLPKKDHKKFKHCKAQLEKYKQEAEQFFLKAAFTEAQIDSATSNEKKLLYLNQVIDNLDEAIKRDPNNPKYLSFQASALGKRYSIYLSLADTPEIKVDQAIDHLNKALLDLEAYDIDERLKSINRADLYTRLGNLYTDIDLKKEYHQKAEQQLAKISPLTEEESNLLKHYRPQQKRAQQNQHVLPEIWAVLRTRMGLVGTSMALVGIISMVFLRIKRRYDNLRLRKPEKIKPEDHEQTQEDSYEKYLFDLLLKDIEQLHLKPAWSKNKQDQKQYHHILYAATETSQIKFKSKLAGVAHEITWRDLCYRLSTTLQSSSGKNESKRETTDSIIVHPATLLQASLLGIPVGTLIIRVTSLNKQAIENAIKHALATIKKDLLGEKERTAQQQNLQKQLQVEAKLACEELSATLVKLKASPAKTQLKDALCKATKVYDDYIHAQRMVADSKEEAMTAPKLEDIKSRNKTLKDHIKNLRQANAELSRQFAQFAMAEAAAEAEAKAEQQRLEMQLTNLQAEAKQACEKLRATLAEVAKNPHKAQIATTIQKANELIQSVNAPAVVADEKGVAAVADAKADAINPDVNTTQIQIELLKKKVAELTNYDNKLNNWLATEKQRAANEQAKQQSLKLHRDMHLLYKAIKHKTKLILDNLDEKEIKQTIVKVNKVCENYQTKKANIESLKQIIEELDSWIPTARDIQKQKAAEEKAAAKADAAKALAKTKQEEQKVEPAKPKQPNDNKSVAKKPVLLSVVIPLPPASAPAAAAAAAPAAMPVSAAPEAQPNPSAQPNSLPSDNKKLTDKPKSVEIKLENRKLVGEPTQIEGALATTNTLTPLPLPVAAVAAAAAAAPATVVINPNTTITIQPPAAADLPAAKVTKFVNGIKTILVLLKNNSTLLPEGANHIAITDEIESNLINALQTLANIFFLLYSSLDQLPREHRGFLNLLKAAVPHKEYIYYQELPLSSTIDLTLITALQSVFNNRDDLLAKCNSLFGINNIAPANQPIAQPSQPSNPELDTKWNKQTSAATLTQVRSQTKSPLSCGTTAASSTATAAAPPAAPPPAAATSATISANQTPAAPARPPTL